MDFKNFKGHKIQILLACLMSGLMIACTPATDVTPDEYVIGEKLDRVHGLNLASGHEPTSVALFDETIRKIHLFNLQNMSMAASFSVRNPEAAHYLLQHDDGNYILDLTTKSVALIQKTGRQILDPVKMVGNPLSAAFSSALGYAVLYYDTRSVGILKVSDQGEAQSSWVGGPLLDGNATVACGDISPDSRGRMILALSEYGKNDQIAIVDLPSTLENRSWVIEKQFVLPFSQVAWLAPLSDPDYILLRSQNKIALVQLSTGTVIDELALDQATVEKYSKRYSPHILMRNFAAEVSVDSLQLVYVTGAKLKVITLAKQPRTVVQSNLDIDRDEWTFIDRIGGAADGHSNANELKTNRTLTRYSLSSLATQQNFPLHDGTQIELSPSFLFTLYPNELGKASRTNILSEEVVEIAGFNVGWL